MNEKKFIRKRNYKNYIKIYNKGKKFKKQSKPIKIKSKKIICFIIFILYVIFMISLAFFIIRKKHIKKNKIKKRNSNVEKLKLLTNNDKTLYEGAEKCLVNNPDEEKCIYQFLCPKEVVNKTKVLMGYRGDGSYVMLDDFENIKIAYSIGIGNMIQFDNALRYKGIDVYMYDHTIEKLPKERSQFHWKKIGIGGNSERAYNIQTLLDMLKENGHLNEKNMILKIDAEGAEWNALNDIPEEVLSQFKYLLLELHFFKNNQTLYYDVLKKLYKTHQVFYVHCCPYLGIITFGNNRICKGIEVSYIIRKGNCFTQDKTDYPIKKFHYGRNINFNVNILKLFDNYEK